MYEIVGHSLWVQKAYSALEWLSWVLLQVPKTFASFVSVKTEQQYTVVKSC